MTCIPQVMSQNIKVTGLTPLSPEEKMDASLTTSQVERKLIEAYITPPPISSGAQVKTDG